MEQITQRDTVRAQLLENSSLYIKSIGELDGQQLRLAPQIGKTTMRLIFGATESMPARGLSYISSAVLTAKELGVSQLQIIHANHLGAHINGINKYKADEAAKELYYAASEMASLYNDQGVEILHAIDSRLDTAHLEPLIIRAFEQNPLVAEKLSERGSRHGGDARRYALAHFAFQDTDELELLPIDTAAPPQAQAEHIISIGCKKEETFYLARMAMRGAVGEESGMIEHTSQLFTRHIVPPYYFAQKGEPTLAEGIDPNGVNLLGPDAESKLQKIPDKDARKDIRHFITIINDRRAA